MTARAQTREQHARMHHRHYGVKVDKNGRLTPCLEYGILTETGSWGCIKHFTSFRATCVPAWKELLSHTLPQYDYSSSYSYERAAGHYYPPTCCLFSSLYSKPSLSRKPVVHPIDQLDVLTPPSWAKHYSSVHRLRSRMLLPQWP